MIQGARPLHFTWFKDGQLTTGQSGYRIENRELSSNLIIEKVSSDENANFSCKVSNSDGVDITSVVINVVGG